MVHMVVYQSSIHQLNSTGHWSSAFRNATSELPTGTITEIVSQHTVTILEGLLVVVLVMVGFLPHLDMVHILEGLGPQEIHHSPWVSSNQQLCWSTTCAGMGSRWYVKGTWQFMHPVIQFPASLKPV